LFLDTNQLTGAVPSLPFKQYTAAAGCCVNWASHTNHFTCPLPASAADCKCRGQPGVICNKKTEWEPRNT
jgi:hypothetical protein